MKKFKNLKEAPADKSAVFSFGRFNPPTTGHEKLLKAADSVARSQGSDLFVYATQSEDPKKNPLSYTDKVKFMRKMFRSYAKSIMADKSIRTAFDVLSKLYKDGYRDVTMVVGGDRVAEFDTTLNKYNGKEGRHGFYDFEGGVKIRSAGNRADPDSDEAKEMSADSMSASVLRKLAADGHFDSYVDEKGKKQLGFKYGVPDTLGDTDKRILFNKVRQGMKLAAINEMFEELFDEKLNEGEVVTEKAPPDEKILKWTEDPKVKKSFKDQYGDKWAEVMYATAWKMYNDKNEEWNIDEELGESWDAPQETTINEAFEKLSFGVLREKLEKVNEAEITQADLNAVEKYADKLFAAVGIDVNFTRHFLDRVNDERNKKQITSAELIRLFKQSYAKYGKKIAQLGPDAEAVLNDMMTDINMPFVLKWDRNSQELDLVAKTIMRKRNFMTTNPKLQVSEFDPLEEKTEDGKEHSWKSLGHYTADGQEWTGPQHFNQELQQVMTGDEPSIESVPLYHYRDLPKEVRDRIEAGLKEVFNGRQSKKIKFVEDINEAKFAVEIGNLPTMYVDAQSEIEVRMELRKLLKKPDMVKRVERVQAGEVRKQLTKVIRGKTDIGIDEEFESLVEATDGWYREKPKNTPSGIGFGKAGTNPDQKGNGPGGEGPWLYYAIKVKGLPEFYLQGKSLQSIRSTLRFTLKYMDDIESIERVLPAEIRADFRRRAYSGEVQQAYAGNVTYRQDAYYRNESVEVIDGEYPNVYIPEMTNTEIKNFILSKTFNKKRYEFAVHVLGQILDRKIAEVGDAKKLRHDIPHYADIVARQIPGVDTRTLVAMVKTQYEALELGTDELVNDYKEKTPGEISEAITYSKKHSVPLHEIFREHSGEFYRLFREARTAGYKAEGLDKYLIEQTDIGEFGVFKGRTVPLDAPFVDGRPEPILHEDYVQMRELSYKGNIGMMELIKFYQVAKDAQKKLLQSLIQAKKEKDAWELIQKVVGVKLHNEEAEPELNSPKRGGNKKYYVYVKNDKGNVVKVEFGDTSGLQAKIDDPQARASFVARHDCDNKKDKTTPGYWSCRLPMYAKELGLEGGGDYFW